MVVLGGLTSLAQLENASPPLQCHAARGRRRKLLPRGPVDRLSGPCGSLRRFASTTGTSCVCTLTAAFSRGMSPEPPPRSRLRHYRR